MDLQAYVSNLSTTVEKKERERGIGIKQEIKQRKSELSAFEIENQVKAATDSMQVEVKRIINSYINRLMILKPTMKQQYKTEVELLDFKREFAYQCYKHKINTKEKLDHGMEYASNSVEKWIDIGQFITWCKEGYRQEIKQKKLLDNVQRITDEKRMLSSRTFEERKQEASENIDKLRAMIAKVNK
jgi:hypothetical protein